MFAILTCLSSGTWRNWRSELFFSLPHPPQISPSAWYMVKQCGSICVLPISPHSVIPGLYIPVCPRCCVHHIFHTVWSSSSTNIASFSCVDIQCSAANTPWWIAPKATLSSCRPLAKAARRGKSSQPVSLKSGWNPTVSRGSGRRGEQLEQLMCRQCMQRSEQHSLPLPGPALAFQKNTSTHCCLLPHPFSPLALPTASRTFL